MSMLQTGRRALSWAAYSRSERRQSSRVRSAARGRTGPRQSRRDRRDGLAHRTPRLPSQSPIVTVDKAPSRTRTAIGLEATLDQLPQFNMTGAGSQANMVRRRRRSRRRMPRRARRREPARPRFEPQPRAARRATRAAGQRLSRRRPQHDPGGRDRQGRGHHGWRGGRVWRRRDRGRRQLRAQEELRRRAIDVRQP